MLLCKAIWAHVHLGTHRALASAHAHDGGRFAVQRRGPAARGPVDRVLQYAADRVVVLGHGEEQPVGRRDGLVHSRDRFGVALRLDVRVE